VFLRNLWFFQFFLGYEGLHSGLIYLIQTSNMFRYLLCRYTPTGMLKYNCTNVITFIFCTLNGHLTWNLTFSAAFKYGPTTYFGLTSLCTIDNNNASVGAFDILNFRIVSLLQLVCSVISHQRIYNKMVKGLHGLPVNLQITGSSLGRMSIFSLGPAIYFFIMAQKIGL